MPSYTFDHVHLVSNDPEKTATFYEKTFGARKIKVSEIRPGRFIWELDLGGAKVLISKPRDDKTTVGLAHFGMSTDNLKEAVAELKSQGIVFTQDITQITPKLKISFLNAPENVSIEVTEGSI